MHEIWNNLFGWGFSVNPHHKRQIPWHRLGTLVENEMSVDEAVQLFADFLRKVAEKTEKL